MVTIADQFLYPPLVETYMPAFVKTTPCRIYFSATDFNDFTDIKHVQLTVSSMATNVCALNTETLWPNGIKLCHIHLDSSITTDYCYYVELEAADLRGAAFATSQYYKVQLRFSAVDPSGTTYDTNAVPTIPIFSGDPGAVWYQSNIDQFSEWSTVCLIKGIPAPVITMKGFTLTNGINYFSGQDSGFGIMTFVGQYQNEDSSEFLKSYKLKLYEGIVANDETIVASSDIQYPTTTFYDGINVLNDFYYRFNIVLKNNTSYILSLEYTTKSGYNVLYPNHNFVTSFTEDVSIPSLTLTPYTDPDNGRVAIRIQTSEIVSGSLLIRRSTHKSNFTIWETLYQKSLSSVILDETFVDYTVESGVLYNYWVSGHTLDDPIMVVFEDIFLVGNNKQLKIRYNPNISSFKYVVADTKIETLGGKYPFIRRNGNTKYLEFGIEGLITAESDTNRLFSTELELYGEYTNLFLEYNTNNNISSNIDYVKEKEFRDRVLDFLYDGKVKLYKSATEGNILVRIMETSLSPMTQLNRMLYSFSASATEVDEFNLETCQHYDVAFYDIIYAPLTFEAGGA